MNLTTKFVPWWYDQAKGSATLFIDGVQTSFDCTHLHKTEAAAEKCHAKVLADAKRYIEHPELEVTQVADNMVEWKIPLNKPGFVSSICRVRFIK